MWVGRLVIIMKMMIAGMGTSWPILALAFSKFKVRSKECLSKTKEWDCHLTRTGRSRVGVGPTQLRPKRRCLHYLR